MTTCPDIVQATLSFSINSFSLFNLNNLRRTHFFKATCKTEWRQKRGLKLQWFGPVFSVDNFEFSYYHSHWVWISRAFSVCQPVLKTSLQDLAGFTHHPTLRRSFASLTPYWTSTDSCSSNRIVLRLLNQWCVSHRTVDYLQNARSNSQCVSFTG